MVVALQYESRRIAERRSGIDGSLLEDLPTLGSAGEVQASERLTAIGDVEVLDGAGDVCVLSLTLRSLEVLGRKAQTLRILQGSTIALESR